MKPPQPKPADDWRRDAIGALVLTVCLIVITVLMFAAY